MADVGRSRGESSEIVLDIGDIQERREEFSRPLGAVGTAEVVPPIPEVRRPLIPKQRPERRQNWAWPDRHPPTAA